MKSTNSTFNKNTKWYMLVSASIILIGIIVTILFGLNMSTDVLGGGIFTANLLSTSLALVISTIIIMVYISIRYDFASSLSIIVSLVHNLLIVFSLVAIFRLQVTNALIIALVFMIGLSILNSLIIFERVKFNRYREKNKNLSHEEVISISTKETFRTLIIVNATLIFTLISLLVISSSSVREIAIALILGLVASIYSSCFIAPQLWSEFIKKDKKIKYATIKEDEEKNDEE